jgi:hypothetical protein
MNEQLLSSLQAVLSDSSSIVKNAGRSAIVQFIEKIRKWPDFNEDEIENKFFRRFMNSEECELCVHLLKSQGDVFISPKKLRENSMR